MPSFQLLLRPDFATKSGGDLVLAREYEKALREAGADARLEALTEDAVRDGTGTAVLFNVDRYFEFAAAATALRRAGRKYVVAPVHHPQAAVARFDARVRSGALGLIGKVGRTPFGRERIKHVIRLRTASGLHEAFLRDPRGVIGQALRSSALVVVQAPGELAEVRNSFGADAVPAHAWIPNGVSVDGPLDIDGDRDIDVLVAGRIEERRNQLRVARALAGTDLAVTFVGGDNPRNPRYTTEFHRTVAASTNLTHIPHVPLEELRRLYGRTKVLLGASYFEVVSLAELEGVAYGCRLISTSDGYMSDYLGPLALYLEPEVTATTLRSVAADSIALGPNVEGAKIVRRDFTWQVTRARFVEACDRAGLMTD